MDNNLEEIKEKEEEEEQATNEEENDKKFSADEIVLNHKIT